MESEIDSVAQSHHAFSRLGVAKLRETQTGSVNLPGDTTQLFLTSD